MWPKQDRIARSKIVPLMCLSESVSIRTSQPQQINDERRSPKEISAFSLSLANFCDLCFKSSSVFWYNWVNVCMGGGSSESLEESSAFRISVSGG
jgi:hypothetical protein